MPFNISKKAIKYAYNSSEKHSIDLQINSLKRIREIILSFNK